MYGVYLIDGATERLALRFMLGRYAKKNLVNAALSLFKQSWTYNEGLIISENKTGRRLIVKKS